MLHLELWPYRLAIRLFRTLRTTVAGPYSPAVNHKIHRTDNHAGTGEQRCRDVGVNELIQIQIMEQKSTLIRLNSSLTLQ
jgi:hypothetical protein